MPSLLTSDSKLQTLQVSSLDPGQQFGLNASGDAFLASGESYRLRQTAELMDLVGNRAPKPSYWYLLFG